ncbi:cation:H+ antiporter [Halogeometricum rufum]|uniref:Cation:H+ antiporter n=1 Tax=Halogeometricum rufum TaxID=553469 RepID=A0A1I6IG52_9EURY|nr:sodium:calcium antiporter [Halogeometricum rufum]SFR65722.1 cation:H+ antiporter [Halogeometricum rufum]
MVSDGAAVQIGILVATVAGLWIGARLLVDSVIRLARRLGLSELTIGLTVVAAGTSTPELVVTADAALAGLGAIAVGNVVGSNIYNLAFILGVVSLVRVIPIERSLVHRDGVVLVASTLVGAAVMFDRTVVRVEGAVLLVSFVAYTAYLLRTGDDPPDTVPSSVRGGIPTALTERVTFRGRDAVLLVLGLAVVLVSGDLMVETASTLARAAVIQPVSFGSVALESVAWLIVVAGVVVAALWTGRKLSRPEGAVFAASEVGRWVLGLLGLVG